MPRVRWFWMTEGARMDDRAVEWTPRPWIPLLAALGLFIGLGGLIYWQWNTLQEREREDSQHRFALEAQDIGQRVMARMQAYEMGPAWRFGADERE